MHEEVCQLHLRFVTQTQTMSPAAASHLFTVVQISSESNHEQFPSTIPICEQCRSSTAYEVEEITVRSECRCTIRLRYVDLVVSIEVAVDVGCCFTVFSC
jgi:hypothetical protein